MANLLKSGYTMLNIACPVCNNPVFRAKDGNTICPICNRNVVLVNQEQSNDKIKTQIKENHAENDNNDFFQALKEMALAKLRQFTDLLGRETNIEESDKLIKIATILMDLVREINKSYQE
ncbi:MAG: hypothetical protein EU549_04945 [Promethearchaeota archaeon]|nr:MAG: hypothetical protein EU549_04945 [Candidatus Lokiarchaeota archaeon]